MKRQDVIGVDLAKTVIQASVVTPAGKAQTNTAFIPKQFAEFLARQKPCLGAFEACATAHYWSWVAQSYGHSAKFLPTKAVAPFRHGHKTDPNEALAVAETAQRPNIKEAPMKTVEQQGLKAIQRSRELLIQDQTALSNSRA